MWKIANFAVEKIAKQGYSVTYINTLTKTQSEMKSTIIQLETGVGPKLEATLIPTVGGAELSKDNTVKNGEVIKYKIQVSNIGSEELTNVTVEGAVPEGTTLVKPQDNYEYTGASYYKELEDKTYKTNIEIATCFSHLAVSQRHLSVHVDLLSWFFFF